MKIEKFKSYLILEEVGINSDIKKLTNQLYELLINSNKTINKFDGSIFKLDKIKIESITVYLIDMPVSGSFDADESKITDNGINIILKINKDEINTEVIHHELNHVLQFYMVGKEKFIKSINNLKIQRLSLNFLNDPMIEEFISLFYYSQDGEISSFVSESYYSIKNNIKFNINDNITENEFNKLFKKYYKQCYIYDASIMLDKFNLKNFSRLNSNNLVIFFNVLNDKKNLLKIHQKSGKFKKFLLDIYDVLTNRYFNDYYYKKIDKSIKIENLDNILEIYDKRFKNASKTIKNKLSKLYSLILDELKHENLIKN